MNQTNEKEKKKNDILKKTRQMCPVFYLICVLPLNFQFSGSSCSLTQEMVIR